MQISDPSSLIRRTVITRLDFIVYLLTLIGLKYFSLYLTKIFIKRLLRMNHTFLLVIGKVRITKRNHRNIFVIFETHIEQISIANVEEYGRNYIIYKFLS